MDIFLRFFGCSPQYGMLIAIDEAGRHPMSSVPSLNSMALMQQLNALQATGSSPSSTQGTGSANDSFSALLSQLLNGQNQAQTAVQASSTGQSNASSGRAAVSADMSALGQALSSGNIAAAQQAFQSLQTDIQDTARIHHHHRHHGGGTEDQTQASTTQTGTGAASTQAASTQTASTGLADALSQISAGGGSQLLGLLMGAV